MTPLPTDRRDAGFTIIEVLIALAIVAVSIVAIGSLMATNVRGVRSLEQHVALMQADAHRHDDGHSAARRASIPVRCRGRPTIIAGPSTSGR